MTKTITINVCARKVFGASAIMLIYKYIAIQYYSI